MLEVLPGETTIDQIARRLGVRPGTVLGGLYAALAGMESALMRGRGPTEQERERENDTLRDALTRNAVQVELCSGPTLGVGVNCGVPLST